MSLELPKGPGSWPKMTDQKRQEVYSKLLDLKGETYKAGREKIAKEILTKITATNNKYELSKPVKDLGKHPVSQAILDAFTQASAENPNGLMPNGLMFYSLDYLVSADENKALNGGKIPNVDLLEPKDHVAIVKDPTGRWRINVAGTAGLRFTGFLFPPLAAATEPPKEEAPKIQDQVTKEFSDRTETGVRNEADQLDTGTRTYKDGRIEKGSFKENKLFTGEFTKDGQTYSIWEEAVSKTSTPAAQITEAAKAPEPAPAKTKETDIANPIDTDSVDIDPEDVDIDPEDADTDDTDVPVDAEDADVPVDDEEAQSEAPTADPELAQAKTKLAEKWPDAKAIKVNAVLADGNFKAKITFQHGATEEGTFDKETGYLIEGKYTSANGITEQGTFDKGTGNLIKGKKVYLDGSIAEGTFDKDTEQLIQSSTAPTNAPAAAPAATPTNTTPTENKEAQTEIQKAKAALEEAYTKSNPTVEVTQVNSSQGIIVAKLTFPNGGVLRGNFDQNSKALIDGYDIGPDGTMWSGHFYKGALTTGKISAPNGKLIEERRYTRISPDATTAEGEIARNNTVLEGTFKPHSGTLINGTITTADGIIHNIENEKEVVKIKLPKALSIIGDLDLKNVLIETSKASIEQKAYYTESVSDGKKSGRVYIDDWGQDTLLAKGGEGSTEAAKKFAEEFNAAVKLLSQNPTATIITE